MGALGGDQLAAREQLDQRQAGDETADVGPEGHARGILMASNEEDR